MNNSFARTVTILIVLFGASASKSLAQDPKGNTVASGTTADEMAVKQVIAGFSDGWNNHDAHAMCASLADDVQWISWRGEVSHSRKEVEDQHAMLFAGLYKNTHRTDTVKSIRYLTPLLVSVDNYWTMTGAKTREGADWPYREGYVNYLMAKRNGHWVIIVSHTADFNAKAPAATQN